MKTKIFARRLNINCCCFSFQLDLKFQAPYKAKTYHYTVTLRSDSYLDLDVHQNFYVSNFTKCVQ